MIQARRESLEVQWWWCAELHRIDPADHVTGAGLLLAERPARTESRSSSQPHRDSSTFSLHLTFLFGAQEG